MWLAYIPRERHCNPHCFIYIHTIMLYTFIDWLLWTETKVEKSNVWELQPIEYVLPPVIDTYVDHVDKNIQEHNTNSILHNRVERRKKSFYNLQK